MMKEEFGYLLQPLQISEVQPRNEDLDELKARSGHRIVANESNVYSFGGYNPNYLLESETNDNDGSGALFDELWKFNISTRKWTKLSTVGNSHDALASNCATLIKDHLLVYGGTGIPFGLKSNNRLSICNLRTLQWESMKTTGELPSKLYGQAMIAANGDIYVVGGTSGYEYSIDVHRLNGIAREWHKLDDPLWCDRPSERYRHEIAYLDSCIYIFGGGTSTTCCNFQKISCFDTTSRKWKVELFQGDNSTVNGFPRARRCHGLVQSKNDVYIIGGYDGRTIFSDIWKADLCRKKWTKLDAILPCPVYFHAVALTPACKLYIFGGVTDIASGSRTNKMYEMWLKVPKLKEACWEALLSYTPRIQSYSKERLLTIGIPLNFVSRIN